MNGSAQAPARTPARTPALLRLALSRESLRLALGGAAVARQGHAGESASPGNRPQDTPPSPMPPCAPASNWLDRLQAFPLAQVLAGAVSGWWMQHPLRPVLILSSVALTVTIKPVARRHPFALVAGALVAGGLLAWLRPWRPLRWMARPALFAGLAQQLLSKTLAEVPLEAWLTAWAEVAQPQQPKDCADPPGGPTDAFQSSSAGS